MTRSNPHELTRFTTPRFTLSDITPLTYRDGESYASLLWRLFRHVTEVLNPSLETSFRELITQLEAEMAKAEQQYVDGVHEFQRIHDAFMSDVNAHLIALNDGAVSDLVDDSSSLLSTMLNRRFVRRSDGPIYAAEFGVRGDTGEDMSGPLQEAIDAAVGVDLILPKGLILAHGLRLMGHNRLIGAGKYETRLRSDQRNTPLIVIAGEGHMLRGLELHSRYGGHVIDQSDENHSVWEGLFYDISFHQEDDHYSIWETNGQDVIDMRFEHFTSRHRATATVPTWHMWTPHAGINANIWSNFRTYYSGNYHFWIESRDTNRTYGNRIEQGTFELCHGGLIKIVSGVGFSLDRIWNWDMDVRPPYTGHRHAISVDHSGRPGMGSIGEINHYVRMAGVLDEGVCDIWIAPDQLGSIVNIKNIFGINNRHRHLLDFGNRTVTFESSSWTSVKNTGLMNDLGGHLSLRNLDHDDAG